MPKYSIVGSITVGVYTEVEADTPEQAREIALARGVQDICGLCSMSRYSSEKASEVWRLSDGLENGGEVEVTEVLDDEGNEICDGD